MGVFAGKGIKQCCWSVFKYLYGDRISLTEKTKTNSPPDRGRLARRKIYRWVQIFSFRAAAEENLLHKIIASFTLVKYCW